MEKWRIMMKIGEFYQFISTETFPDGTKLICVIKLLRRIPAGQTAVEGGYTFKEDGYDYVTLLCNTSLMGGVSPIVDSDIQKNWRCISEAEVLELEKQEMAIDPSTWNHDYFMEQFQRTK